MKYVFKQRYRPVDTRDGVLIAKLALEYRNLKALTNGNEKLLFKNEN